MRVAMRVGIAIAFPNTHRAGARSGMQKAEVMTMDFHIFAATVPGPIELGTLAWLSLAAVAAALAPLGLVLRHVLGFRSAEPERAQLRLIEGGRELGRKAA